MTWSPPTARQMLDILRATRTIAVVGASDNPARASYFVGTYLLASTDPTASHTPVWWMPNGGADAANPNPLTPEAGCTGGSNGDINLDDLAKIPSADMYGNAMNTSGYTNSSRIDSSGNVSSIYNGTALDLTQPTQDYHWGLAIWNSVDNAADNIRNDSNYANRTGDTQQMPVTIHVIAYTANSGVDQGLLKRVANTTDSTSFSAAQPQGLYVPAGDSTALANAFDQVASSLLHLTR